MTQITKEPNNTTSSNEKLSAIFETGKERISHKINWLIDKIISKLSGENKKEILTNQTDHDIKNKKDYFDNLFTSDLSDTCESTDIDVSNITKIVASDGSANDFFGYSIAVSKTKIVIGVPYDNDKGPASGSVYIYDLDGSNEIKLTASDGAAGNYFGYSVAVSDTKIVVGAYGHNDNGFDSGCAYIYDIDGTNEIKLLASDGTDDDRFGSSVAVSNTKIVIGAYSNSDKGPASGSAYIYDLNGTNEIKLYASDGVTGNYFGFSVDVSDTKIVIGAYGNNDKGSYAGCAYAYDLDGTNEIKLLASDGADYNNFGSSVAISNTKIVIGVPEDNDKGSYSGSAYIYDLDGTNEIKLLASDGAAHDNFGRSVAVSDTKIVIGAYGKDINGSYSGCIYAYDLNGSNEIKLTPTNSIAYDYFGFNVAVSDDRIVIGAYGDNDNGTNSGSAYIFG